MFEYDVFISHASEDKSEFVRPLAQALVNAGVRVWFDDFTLKLGDSLRQSIDDGLAKSRYGVVVLSPAFFQKDWPQKELDALISLESLCRKVILPIHHKVNSEYVRRFSPLLADRFAISSSTGIDNVVSNILAVLNDGNSERADSPDPDSASSAADLPNHEYQGGPGCYVPVPKKCPQCGQAGTWSGPHSLRSKYSDLTLQYVCSDCNYRHDTGEFWE